MVYQTYGELNEAKDNAILICHALSGNHHVAGLSEDDKKGWWDDMVGPDKAFDTNKYFIVGCNNLGGCHGSTCLLYTSPSPRDREKSRMPSSA